MLLCFHTLIIISLFKKKIYIYINFFRYLVNNAPFLGSLLRCDVERGRSQRFFPQRINGGRSALAMWHTAANRSRARCGAVKTNSGDVTSRSVLCCHQLLSGRRRKSACVSRLIVSPRADRSTLAPRSELRDGTGWLIETPEPRRSPTDSINYITEGIDKTKKNCDNGLVPIQVGVEAIFICSECYFTQL